MRKKLLVESSFVVEGGTIRARLISEGTSKNRNYWSRATLEKMVPLLDGVPVHLYDTSRDGSRSMLDHWETWRHKLAQVLPPDLAALLPERWKEREVAVIRNPQLVVNAGVASIESDLEMNEERGGLFRAVLGKANQMRKTLGLSIHVPADGLATKVLDDGRRLIENVTRVAGFDVVSFPSAGGRVIPVLEALRRSPMKKLLAALLRLVPESNRVALEGLIKSAKVEDLDSLSALVESEEGAHRKVLTDLIEALDLNIEADFEDEDDRAALVPTLEAIAKVGARVPEPKQKSRKAPAPKPDTGPAPTPASDPALEARIKAAEDASAAALKATQNVALQQGRDLIGAIVESSKLPEKVAAIVSKQLNAALESDGAISKESCTEAVEEMKKALGGVPARKSSILESADRVSIEHGWTSGERIEAAMEAMLCRTSGERNNFKVEIGGKTETVRPFQSLKQAYQVCSNDFLLEGSAFYGRQAGRGMAPALESVNWDENQFYVQLRARMGALLEATMTTASFPLLLANVMHKRMLREYQSLAHVWRMIARPEPVSDFRERRIVQFGEFGQLALVNENSNPSGYADLSIPTEDDITATVAKYGGLAKISWETVVNDDVRKLRQIPMKLGRAAERTLNTLVWGKILNNSNIYDGTALFTAGHGNLNALAFNDVNLKAARLKMTRQKDLDDAEAGRVTPRNLFTGPLRIDEAAETIGAAGKARLSRSGEIGTAGGADTALTDDNPGQPNVFRTRYGFNVVEVHEFDEVAGADDNWYLAADPDEAEVMEVGFLNGQEDPSIFIQDLERVGSFFDDDVTTMKVRHVHDGGVVLDYRGLQGGIP